MGEFHGPGFEEDCDCDMQNVKTLHYPPFCIILSPWVWVNLSLWKDVTPEIVTLYGKREMIWLGLMESHESFKSWAFSLAGAEGKVRENGSNKKDGTCYWWLKMKGACGKECTQPLEAVSTLCDSQIGNGDPRPTALRNWILPATWMERSSSLQPDDRNPV